jgi:hypothetical protein
VNEKLGGKWIMSLYFVLMGLTNPMTWLIAAMAFAYWSRKRRPEPRGDNSPQQHKRAGFASDAGLAAAFQLLSLAYRPNHAFVAKAQIQQQEDTDEDDEGDPESPIRHLHRQLRRIRRGEHVERLIWKLE